MTLFLKSNSMVDRREDHDNLRIFSLFFIKVLAQTNSSLRLSFFIERSGFCFQLINNLHYKILGSCQSYRNLKSKNTTQVNEWH